MLEIHENTRPYPGLRPFEYWENELFFGREEHTNRLLDILQQHNFLSVIGPSGSGKSSLVRAGLLPSLPLGCIGTGSDWRIAIMRPGHRPLQKLAQALLGRLVLGVELVGEDLIPETELTLTSEVAIIEAELRRGPLGLIQLVNNAKTRNKSKEPFNLLVLVDQFEEIFTYADAGGKQADESEAFINLLLASRLAKDAQIYIALTMRTDFLGNCVRFLDLPDVLNQAQYLTPRLTREQIQKAITGPAHLFEGDIEPALVAELINEVSDDSDQLPILQHALARMWDKASARDAGNTIIQWEDFHAVGGIANALSGHADEILATLNPDNKIEEPLSDGQQLTEILFRAITDQRSAEAGGQAVRRPQTLERIAAWSGRDWQEFKPVIEAYTKEGVNFLHINAAFDKETVVDISHEALIRQWKRLQEWVAQEARFANDYRRLLERTLDWQEAEQKKKGSGSLLTGADLARALEWQQGQYGSEKADTSWAPNTHWADRYGKHKDDTEETEFEDVTKYIEESNALLLRTEKRERRVKKILIGTLISCFGFMLIALWFAIQFRAGKTDTEVALLWNSLNFSSDEINNNQAEALLALSTYDESNKKIFIGQLWNESDFDQFLTKETLATNFNHKPGEIIRALVSINTARRNELINLFLNAPHGDDTHDLFLINRALALIELESDAPISVMLDAIGTKFAKRDVFGRNLIYEALVKKIDKMPESELLQLADQLIAAELSPVRVYPDFNSAWEKLAEKASSQTITVIVDKSLNAMKPTDNTEIMQWLARDLSLVSAKVSSDDAEPVFYKLFTAMETAKDKQKSYYFDGLVAIAEQIPGTQAEKILGKLMTAMKEIKDPNQRKKLVKILVAVTKKAPDTQVITVFNQLFEAMNTAQEPDKPYYYSEGLATLAEHIPSTQAEAFIGKLIGVIKIAKDSYHREDLAKALAAITKKVPNQKAVAAVDQLLNAAKNTKEADKSNYYNAKLPDAAEKVTEGQAVAVIGKLIAAMKNAKDSNQRDNLVKDLEAITKQVDNEQAATVVDQLLDAAKNAKEPDRPEYYSARLPDVAEKVPEGQANTVIDKLIAAMKNTKDSYQREDLVKTLAALSKKVPKEQFLMMFDQFFAEMEKAKDSDRTNNRSVLLVLADNAPDTVALEIFNKLFDAMRAAKEPDQPYDYSAKLPMLAEKVPETEAGEIISKLSAALKEVKKDSYQQREDLAKALAAIAKKTPEAKAVSIVTKFIEAIKNHKNEGSLETLGEALEKAAQKVPNSEINGLAKRIISEMEDTIQTGSLKGIIENQQKTPQVDTAEFTQKVLDFALGYSNPKPQLKALSRGLMGIAAKISEPEAVQHIQKLFELIQNNTDIGQIEILSGNIVTLSTGLKPDIAVKFLFKTLANPLTPRDLLAKAIRDRFPDEKQIKEELGYWKLIEWGTEKKYINDHSLMPRVGFLDELI